MRIGLLLLRLVVGGIFAAHGYTKLFGSAEKPVPATAARYLGQGFVQMSQHGLGGFAGMLQSMGVPFPDKMARFVGGVEFFGGIALALGFLTRLAALLLAGDMAVAIWKVHWKHGLMGEGGFEFPLSLLGGSLALLAAGPGRLSLDSLFFADRRDLAIEDLQIALLGALGRR